MSAQKTRSTRGFVLLPESDSVPPLQVLARAPPVVPGKGLPRSCCRNALVGKRNRAFLADMGERPEGYSLERWAMADQLGRKALTLAVMFEILNLVQKTIDFGIDIDIAHEPSTPATDSPILNPADVEEDAMSAISTGLSTAALVGRCKPAFSQA